MALTVARKRSKWAIASRVVERVLVYSLLVAGSLVFAFPFFWMVMTSLLSMDEIAIYPPIWIPDPPRWGNYADMWEQGPFTYWVRNSITVTALSVTGNTISSTLAAYGFARTRFPGRDKLFIMVLATLMIPFHVYLVPQFVLFWKFGWLDKLYALWVPAMFGSAFSIFILRQYFLTLPRELDEAAIMDGANKVDILAKVVLPLSKPAIATVAIFTFIGTWNEFVRPLVFLRTPNSLTLAVGIRWFTGRYGTYFHWLMCGSVVALMPIIITFFFVQKTFIQGIALTGIKG